MEDQTPDTSAPRGVSPKERPSLLVLLMRDPLAQRLIAVWPNVDRSGNSENDIIERWARMANCRENEVANKWSMLVGNGFVKMDGTVDEFAEKFVTSVAASALPRKQRRNPTKEEPAKAEEGGTF